MKKLTIMLAFCFTLIIMFNTGCSKPDDTTEPQTTIEQVQPGVTQDQNTPDTSFQSTLQAPPTVADPE